MNEQVIKDKYGRIKGNCASCGKPVTKGYLHCIRCSKLGDKNPRWNDTQIFKRPAIHLWVRTRLPKPEYCEICNKVPPYDLANKGVYNRDLSQWWWLCRKCHMESDHRLEQLIQRNKTMVSNHIKKTHCKYGHPFDNTNTFISKRGSRVCLVCRYLWNHGTKPSLVLKPV